MLTLHLYAVSLALALGELTSVSAQSTEKLWAVFAYTLYGDSTPTILPRSKVLTSYGASQLYAAGSAFRDRYVAIRPNENKRIQNLSPYALDPDEVHVLSTDDQFTVASAQAFMQGLYPPLDQSYEAAYIDDPSLLANKSLAAYPLSGYQYPRLITLGGTDPGFVSLAGHTGCPLHEDSRWEYRKSTEFQEMVKQSAEFYARVYDKALSGVLNRSQTFYDNAYYISEYLEYESRYNSTLFYNLEQEDIYRARWLADRYVYATNGHVSSSGSKAVQAIRSIAGQTLAPLILQAFEQSIEDRGSRQKMTLAFGSHEPPVALASLMFLASSRDANFYSRPAQGASIAFELYSFENEPFPAYPDLPNLYVRFLLHNGTDSSTAFTPYPLFGRGPSNIAIPYAEFRAEMQQISLSSIEKWCLGCGSSSVFCYGSVDGILITGLSNPSLKIAAGVIGGITGLVVVLGLLTVGIQECCTGQRRRHMSGCGGFKGSRKMASDCDVTSRSSTRKSGNTVESMGPDDGQSTVIGHECPGSWEMTQQMEIALASPAVARTTGTTFGDENEEEWRWHSTFQPVRIRENV